MSLINDALRRARQAHAAGGFARPPRRPCSPWKPRRVRRHGSLFTLPFMGAVVLLLAGITLWGWSQAGKIADIKVRANSRAPGGDTVSVPEPPVTPPLPQPVTVVGDRRRRPPRAFFRPTQ